MIRSNVVFLQFSLTSVEFLEQLGLLAEPRLQQIQLLRVSLLTALRQDDLGSLVEGHLVAE